MILLKNIEGIYRELPKQAYPVLYKQKNSNYNQELELTYEIKPFISPYEKNRSHFPSPVLTVSGSMGIISA
ncbi:hypothetical protein SP4011_15940 [Streptococcus parapneumoniae]|uniref:Uncharacterized protein n=1 Tax=Streptococcus parapneumoniae TaxID=2993430 RepID=A0ABN6TQP2_9STRE|nr:hypothetical protein SP4011_15940 [Streptococcus sp. SP4011]